MLDFYLGTNPNSGFYSEEGYIGGIELEEWSYLSKFGFITSISYFDDKIFTYEEVLIIAEKLNDKLIECKKIPRFNSKQVNKLNELLNMAIIAKEGISTVCD